MNAVKLTKIKKEFGSKVLFEELDLEIKEGEFVAITGGSGSGKTTLLNIIGLIEKSSFGEVTIFHEKNLKPNTRKTERTIRNFIGYLFQNYALIDNESVEDNLKIGLKYRKLSKEQEKKAIRQCLEEVGLTGFEKRKIFELSGGEQQRVALARIMLKPSKLILADEPTGSLDADNREVIIDLLEKMNREGKTIIIVTHDSYVANRCHRIIHLG